MPPALSIQEARILHIDIEADRYGRLRPCIWLSALWNPRARQQLEQPRLYLDSLAQLTDANYQTGDTVTVRYYGAIPKLIKRRDVLYRSVRPPAVLTDRCPHCHAPLKREHGQYYCGAEHCPLKLYAQLRYAIRPDVLDLPFDKDILDEIIWGRELIDDVSSLCFLDQPVLAGLSLHADEIDVIVDVLQNRQRMLAGYYQPQTPQDPTPVQVQRLTRGRFLEALSLPGLYRPTIQCLLEHLDQRHWTWDDLAHLLIDHTALTHYGVAIADARLIKRHAYSRGLEFDRLSRTF